MTNRLQHQAVIISERPYFGTALLSAHRQFSLCLGTVPSLGRLPGQHDCWPLLMLARSTPWAVKWPRKGTNSRSGFLLRGHIGELNTSR